MSQNVTLDIVHQKNKEKVAMFRFPVNEEMRGNWIRAIPRENLNVTSSTRVCSKHFSEGDFENTSTDRCKSRQQKRDSQDLKRLRLKPTAVPHIFQGLPKYLSKTPTAKRTTSASTASARLELENLQIQQENNDFLQMDQVSNLNELKEKISVANLPAGYIKVEKEQFLHFYYIVCDDNSSIAPNLMASIIIEDDLSLKAFVSSVLVPKEMYKHFLSCDSITTVTEVCNILALCKNLCSDLHSDCHNNCKSIKLAIAALKHIDKDDAKNDDDISHLPMIRFITEQLQLLQLQKNAQRYSPELITVSFLWKLSSSSLYKRLSDFFMLPSIRRLQQLSVDLAVETGKVDICYLKQRVSNLTDGERTVVLLIDEVYTAQRVEYSNGSFIGLTENGRPAKTVLAFMVQSVCKNYRDVVCLVPIEKLDTKLLRFYFDMVMEALDEIYFVTAVSVDNHICNR